MHPSPSYTVKQHGGVALSQLSLPALAESQRLRHILDKLTLRGLRAVPLSEVQHTVA